MSAQYYNGIPARAAAFRLGLSDARRGSAFRDSIPPGHPLREEYLSDYDKGWKQGRDGK